jgi:GNAT superfamily N-acetyltransferase
VISVRPAIAADIPAMSRVMIASITDLAVADHKNDPARIASWTANKTEAGITKMLGSESIALFVAERDGVIAAVGAIIEPDTIGLNYVDPAHRFAGVSKALLVAMEDVLRRQGIAEGKLHSTETAHRFYLAAGWQDVGVPEEAFGMRDYPMRKQLD